MDNVGCTGILISRVGAQRQSHGGRWKLAFYKVAPVNGQMGFVVVEKPAGVVTVKALPADVQPRQVGSVTYLVSGGRHYLVHTDAAGQESYLVVDVPKAAG